MQVFVISEIRRRIAAEISRIAAELEKLGRFQFRLRSRLAQRSVELSLIKDALDLERALLDSGNSPDPHVAILGELYCPGNEKQEYHIGLWTGELRRAV